MYFSPFVIDAQSGKPVDAFIAEAEAQDINSALTSNGWQSDWNSEYLSNPDIRKYALKSGDGDLLALGAYQIIGKQAYVFIVYVESAPHSNPTLSSSKRYYGIGKLMFAFGIKYSVDNGCRGDIVFEAKTDELARHYERDFKAVRIPSGSGIKRYMIADEIAWELFSCYLKEDDSDE